MKDDHEQRVEEFLAGEREQIDLELSRDSILDELYEAALVLKDRASFVKNIGIENRHEEKQRFLESRRSGEKYEPGFRFKEFPYDEKRFIELLEQLKDATDRIDSGTLEKYGAEEITVDELRSLFRGVFEEFELYVKLAANVENRDRWKEISLEIWPMVDEETVEKSRRALEKGFDTRERKGGLRAEDVKEMWEEELRELGVEWSVETRKVSGCFNIPEERTVVVAEGDGEERLYTEAEARLLTIHEIFHVVRAYNGIKTGEEAGFPPILGMHTPFYDMTEEGGAIYREEKTGVITPAQEKDYHLRLLAAYYIYKDLDFEEITDRLIELGATPERAFELVARNREILRHHIYLGGTEKWRDRDELWPLLVGKVNSEFAEVLKREVEAGGMLQEPPVTAEDLFQPRSW
ncbi:MAG: tyrosine/phenylalanine carboxypeptidase domain-containing protein [Candidatus Nanohaloarchaea archaeon]